MEGKPKVGKAYLFDSAPQEAFVAWQRPVTLKGRRMLIKAKDTLMDKLHAKGWVRLICSNCGEPKTCREKNIPKVCPGCKEKMEDE